MLSRQLFSSQQHLLKSIHLSGSSSHQMRYFSLLKGVQTTKLFGATSFYKTFPSVIPTTTSSSSSFLLSKIAPSSSLLDNAQQTRNYALPRRVKTKLWYEKLKKEKLNAKGKVRYARQQPEVNNTFILQQLAALKGNRNWKRAYKLFKRLEETRANPTIQVYRKFLYVIAYRGGAMKEGFEIFKYMKKLNSGWKDIRCYNTLIHACTKHKVPMNAYVIDHDKNTNSFNTAVKLYSEIKEKRITKTSFTIAYMAHCVQRAVEQGLIQETEKQEWLSTLTQDGQPLMSNTHVQKALQTLSQAVLQPTSTQVSPTGQTVVSPQSSNDQAQKV
ncbi:hypothetical protein FDP41_012381 [Naegleria fowleri]|uniref:Pentacotripeptide-repeat region of PRORP domain-containing protein n=1 Tax=Naegleria fowleri TaxID=5763 RepID=A0A6A5C5I0_NAEFO|nr:uncharacterized protein FDP41_012381 [Naegleria fowleri]KAF0981724.1 hypothetical protein FDP41_012381 [Naegleria fowleri]CAG4712093.1 unnamed protein product [Naegleria fowleri]